MSVSGWPLVKRLDKVDTWTENDYVGIAKITFPQSDFKMGSINGNRIAYNGVGVLRRLVAPTHQKLNQLRSTVTVYAV